MDQTLPFDAYERFQSGDFLRQAGVVRRIDHLADILVGPGFISNGRSPTWFLIDIKPDPLQASTQPLDFS